jgi:NOL1/NOP2/sun family putative RNA methylase
MSITEIPARFLERMQDMLGDDFLSFAAIYNHPPTHGLRVNTLKLSSEQFAALSPFQLTPLPWSPAGFLVTDETRPGKHPYHAAGLYYLQDPHAQAVAEVLAPQPGDKVLDLAAAPGGKTTHLASCMQNQGLLVANEIKTKRIGHLVANMERWGARNAVILNESPERLAEFFGPFFDRVLVDAPCSGEGMFRKERAAIQGWSEEAILGCAVRQNAILNYAARLVRPGGWLCYSTCTFAMEEDEQVISHFLELHKEYDLAPIPASAKLPMTPSPNKMARLWPHQSSGEGHFIALMQRTGTAHETQDRRLLRDKRGSYKVPRSVLADYDAWCGENLASPLPVQPTQAGSRLYAIPEELPDVIPLRVLHPGWWLGTSKKDRFEPAHALAMGLRAMDVQHKLLLPIDSPETLRYLRCESFPSGGDNGWVLVAVSGPVESEAFPLGWGKRTQGILKNHYPHGLKWL